MNLTGWLMLIGPGVVLLLACLGFARLIGRLETKIDSVEKQFKPNGGSSLKDDINKLKGDVRDINTKFDTHIQHHNGGW